MAISDPVERGSRNESGARLWSQQVQHLFAYAPVNMLATLINCLVLGAVFWSAAPREVLLPWIVVNLALLPPRYMLVRRYRRDEPESPPALGRYRPFVVLLALSGAAMGSAGVLFFPVDSAFHEVFLIFVLGGMVAGASTAFSITPLAFLAYTVPVALPLFLRLLATGSPLHALMGGLLALFWVLMTLNAFAMGRLTRSSFEARIGHLSLIDSLRVEKAKAEGAVEALEREMTERLEAQKALLASEQQFRMLVETLNEGLGVVNERGAIEYVNNRLCEIVGRPDSELLGKAVADLFEDPFRPRFDEAAFQRRLKRRMVSEMELVTPAGKRVSILVSASPRFDESEGFRGIIAAITDITYLKQAEKSLRESGEQYRMIFQNSPLGIVHFDRHGNVTACNPAMGAIAGSNPQRLAGIHLPGLIEDDAMKGAIELCLAGKHGHYEGHYQSVVGGRWRYLKATFGPILAEDGTVLGGIGIIEDVSDRKRAEREMQDQLRLLQTLINTIPNPVFFKDINGVYFGCNRAFQDRMGLTREQIIGKTVYDILPLALAEPYDAKDRDLLANPGEDSSEGVLLYADGSFHSVIVNKATFTDAEGHVAGLVGVDVDITERKRAEEELRRAHDDLERRVAQRTGELALANEELKLEIAEREKAEQALRESSEKLKLFAYSVAHDLKSPAVGIFGLTRLLHKHYSPVLDERGKLYCDQILKSSEHLAALVDEINAYVAAKEAPLRVEEVSLQEVLQMVQDEFSPRLRVRQIQWILALNAREARADRLALLRLFRNLVDNALKYGGDPLTEIRVGCRELEDAYLFSVSDNGVGISREAAEKIFGLFQRDNDSWGTEGTGLGLAIVKELVERHRGKVWVEAGAGGGTTFFFTISKQL
jgi:PAS domain S-box-containing protein